MKVEFGETCNTHGRNIKACYWLNTWRKENTWEPYVWFRGHIKPNLQGIEWKSVCLFHFSQDVTDYC